MTAEANIFARGATRPRILVVDDDLFIRVPLEHALEQEGFHCVSAANGAECMDRIADSRPDLIILDVVMPGRTGVEVCRTIKSEARYASIPVILLSSNAEKEDRERGLEAGAADFVPKPYSPSVLLGRVRELLSQN